MNTKMKLRSQHITKNQITNNQLTNMKGDLYAIPSHKPTVAQMKMELTYKVNSICAGRSLSRSDQLHITNLSHSWDKQITFFKRSNVMKATKVISRGIITLLSLLLFVGVTFGQNLILKSATPKTYNGTYNVKGNIDNTAAGDVITFSGTVNLNSTGGGVTQYIAGNSGAAATKALIIYNLNTSSASAKSQKYTVTVYTDLAVGTTGVYSVNANTLNVRGTSAGTAFDANDGSSIVNYMAPSGSQTILPTTYGGTLALSDAGTKNITGDVKVAKTMTHADAGNLVVGTGGTLTFNNGSLASTLLGVNVNDAAAVIDNKGDNKIQITTLVGNIGTIKTSGASTTGEIAFVNDITNPASGTITTAAGILTFDGSLVNNASVTVSGGGKAYFKKNVTGTPTEFTFADNSTAYYDGAQDQTIGATTGVTNYYNLNLGGGSYKKSASGNMALGGTLTMAASTKLDMLTAYTLSAATYTLDATSRVRFGGNNGTDINAGIVEYYATGAQDVTGGTYAALDLTGTGATSKSLADDVNTNADLTVNSTVTLLINGKNLVVGLDGTGDLIIEDGATVTNNGTITVGQ
jgi:T5SS/PEP-CTERM-associated repeat protein